MKKKIKILFFTPYAGRTGSEMSLYNYITHFDKDKFEIELFSMRNGELLNDLKNTISVHYDNSNSTIFKRIHNKIRNKFGLISLFHKRLLSIHNRLNPDIWFLNTMVLDSVAEVAKINKIPFCVYFHELLSQYNFINKDSLNVMVRDSLFTIGCSDIVCNNLKILGSNKILKQFECINTKIIDSINLNYSPKLISEKKSEGYKIITMSGQRIDRKGFDIFVKIAKELKDEAIHFLWLGSTKNSGYEYFIDCLIATEEINNITIIHPKNNEYYQYLNNTDLFFLSSIEDPFPLVMLEAGYLNKYIVAFKSGGVEEFLENHNGLLLDMINIEYSANELKKVLKNEMYKQNITIKKFVYSAEIQTKNLETLLLDNILKE